MLPARVLYLDFSSVLVPRKKVFLDLVLSVVARKPKFEFISGRKILQNSQGINNLQIILGRNYLSIHQDAVLEFLFSFLQCTFKKFNHSRASPQVKKQFSFPKKIAEQ